MKLATVKRLYRGLNEKNFGGVLFEPVIRFSRTTRLDGFYEPPLMAFNLKDTKGYYAVRELIYHEMVHQYVDEFLGVEDTNHHGVIFKQTYNKFWSDNMVPDLNYHYGDV